MRKKNGTKNSAIDEDGWDEIFSSEEVAESKAGENLPYPEESAYTIN